MKNIFTFFQGLGISTSVASILTIIFCFNFILSTAQTPTDGDYRTRASGNWSAAGTWQVRASSSWSNTTVAPTAANNIYIQSGHTLTIDVATADCKDLHIRTTSGSNGSVSIGTNVLQVSGKLRAYTGAAVTTTGADGAFYSGQANSTSPLDAGMLSTSGSGVLRFIGTSRTITSYYEWNANGTGHATEFALTPGNTGTFYSGYKTSGLVISSGTMEMAIDNSTPATGTRLGIDNGTSGQGNCTIQSGAALVSSNSGTGGLSVMSRTGNSSTGTSGTFTLYGKLILKGGSPEIQFTTININTGSTIEYAGAGQNFVTKSFTGAAAVGSAYYNVTFSGSGTKTPPGNFNVANNLYITGTATLPLSSLTITVGGNWTNDYGTNGLTESTSTVDFNGTGAQVINTNGGEDFFKVKKSAAGTLTQNADVRFAGTSSELNISSGVWDAGTNVLSGTASSTLTMSGGTLKLARTGVTLPQFTGTYALSGGTIELNGTGAQSLIGGVAFRNLSFSNSTTTTLASNPASITGTVYVTNSAILDIGSSNGFGNGSTNLTMDGGRFKMSGVSSTKPDIDGTYTLTGGVIDFNGSSGTRQNIKGKTNGNTTDIGYQQIEVTGTNVGNGLYTILLNAGGSFTVKNGGTVTISDVAISGPTGSQAVTVENGGLFKTTSNQGFHGYSTIFANNSAIHQNVENIVLAAGSTVEYARDGDQPITNTPALVYQNLTLSGTTGNKTAPASTLTVNGNLTKSGTTTFVHNNGTVLLSGTASQAYSSTAPVMAFYNLTNNNTVNLTINNDLSVSNTLLLGDASKLNLGAGNITIKSTSAGTANIDKIPATAAINYNASGRFIIERYIPSGIAHGKSWQFLAVPANGGQTINAAWQEGNAPLGNLTPGYGTIITNPSVGTGGFDIVGGGAVSMKTYVPATNNWTGITGTISTDIYNQKGYMIFVRGDRSVTTTGASATSTTLRTTGKIFDPVSNIPPTVNVGSTLFESVGNPFASAIDFSNDAGVIKSANVQKVFYVWDPKLTGGYGFGAFQTFTKGDDPDNNYYVSPGGGSYGAPGSVNNIIQGGQAFFVHTFGGTGTVDINENAKTGGSAIVFRQENHSDPGPAQLRNNLYAVSNGSTVLIDGVLSQFNVNYSNNLDILDALKIGNFGENIAITSHNLLLSVERRNVIKTADTIYYRLGSLKASRYQFRFTPYRISKPGLLAFLEDTYLSSKTALNLVQPTTVNFTITNIPASYSPDRFRVVFRTGRGRPEWEERADSINDIGISPNPVSGKLIRLHFNNRQAENYHIRLISQSGQLMLEQDITVPGDHATGVIDAAKVPSGIYRVVIGTAGQAVRSIQVML